MAETLKQRPQYRNIHVTQILRYRLPPSGQVSILHRISGVLLFLGMPFLIWLFDLSLTSEISYGVFTSVFSFGAAGLPGWFFKLLALVLIWAYLTHLFAGLRHLWMDATHATTKAFGRNSALVSIWLAVVVTLALAWKLFA